MARPIGTKNSNSANFKINKQCKTCNNEYSVYKRNSKSEYCSRECYWVYRRNNPDVKIQSNQSKKLIKKICLYCAKEYETYPYRDKTTLFCSRTCKHEHKRNNIKCKTCGINFTAPLYRERIYCSHDCAIKGIDKRESKFSRRICNILDAIGCSYTKEEKISTCDRTIWADICINSKYVIECYGDYWHCNPDKYDGDYYHKQIKKSALEIWEYDSNRLDFIKEQGYVHLVLWENSRKKISDNIIMKIIKDYISNGI